MTGIVLPRRQLLTGLVGFIAAPAIVRASSLMPVKTMSWLTLPLYRWTAVGGEFVEVIIPSIFDGDLKILMDVSR